MVWELRGRRAPARHRALSRHLLAAYGALRDRLGTESDSLLDAVLHRRHRASSAIEGFNAALRPYLYVHKEASYASVSVYDAEGERLATLRMARMPEGNKATLKTMVAAEVEAMLGQRPDLELVKIADGAKDNWTFLGDVLPDGVEFKQSAPHGLRRGEGQQLAH